MSRPTPDELAEAIEEFLSGEVLPTLDDHRLRFRMLVALNALGILRRELRAVPEKDDSEARELATRIRAGDVPAGTLGRVKEDVSARLAINSPRYLDRYDTGTRSRWSGPMSQVGEVPDHTLWHRAANGDADAFGSLFERHASRIYNYCFRRTGDWARAEDLTSATFLVAWKSCRRGPLRAESALPLLYGIATNVLRNQRRSLKRGREAFARLPLPQLEEPDFAGDTAERLDDRREMEALLVAFAQLPRREQDVVALCDWSDLSYDEAATALGIPIGTVRSRLARGRGRLRELAGASGPERDVTVVPLPIEVNKR